MSGACNGFASHVSRSRRRRKRHERETPIPHGPVQFSAAVVLRSRPYGESDRIVTFLTRDAGKLSGIAKGAQRSRRRFMGSLEPFTHIRLGYRQRRETDLCFVESADIVRSPRNVGRDLERYAYSTYVLELVDCMVEGREADPSVFDLVETLLDRIDRNSPAQELLRWFELHLLALCGFEPNLGRCRACGRPTSEAEEPFRFDPRKGDLLCGTCGGETGIATRRDSLTVLERLLDAALPEVGPAPQGPAGEIRVLLQTFINHHARRPLRTPSLLRDLVRQGTSA